MIILTLASDGLVKGQPPEPPAGHGLDGNQGQGGFAPLDGGSLFLLLGGLVYGAYKLLRGNKGNKGAC